MIKEMFMKARFTLLMPLLVLFAMLAITGVAQAAGTTGTVLQPTYNLLNDLANGYGKQIIILVGFVAAMLALVALRGFAPILGYIGFAIFAGVGLALGLGVAGALI
jgi:hypothetical protein